MVLFDCMIRNLFDSRVALNPGLGHLPLSLLSCVVLILGCCISKGSPFPIISSLARVKPRLGKRNNIVLLSST